MITEGKVATTIVHRHLALQFLLVEMIPDPGFQTVPQLEQVYTFD